jgi:hypothetical protein
MITRLAEAGHNFRTVLAYDLQPAKRAELLGGTMRAETARGLAEEFAGWRALNERIAKPVFHCSLSAAPQDRITAELWLEIAGVFAERMGYGNSAWIAIRHHDRPHDHIHIVASRMDHHGRYVWSFQERRRGQEVCREIVREHGLCQLRSLSPRTAPTPAELDRFERTGAVTVKARLQEHLDLAARDRPTMGQFVERLAAHGIEVRAHLAAGGQVAGISFAFDGVAVSGSRLGRGYSWRALQESRGIVFDPQRDLPALRAAAGRATSRIAVKKPFARAPGAPPMPELARPAEAFRQAAVVESRADLEERRRQLTREVSAARDDVDQARRWNEEAARLDRVLAGRRQAVAQALGAIYADPAAACRRLSEILAQEGPAGAAHALEHDPAALGALHGHALAGAETRARRAARGAAPEAARKLWDLVEADAGARAHRSRAEPVAHALHVAEQRASQAADAFRRLPETELLRRDLLRAGGALGSPAVQSLSERAVRAFAAAVEAAGQAVRQRLARGRGAGAGRDDDGLSR